MKERKHDFDLQQEEHLMLEADNPLALRFNV